MKKQTFIKPILGIAIAGMISSCGSGPIISPPIEAIDAQPLKTQPLSDVEKKNWKDYDLIQDTIPGMSVNRAYEEIISQRKKGKKVVVAVIDSGIDVEHEDLDDVLWTNDGEIPGNGKDDDKNGYIDDVHGWNFLGDIVDENLEYERILRDKDMLPADMVEKAQKEYDQKVAEAQAGMQRYEAFLAQVNNYHPVLVKATGKQDYVKADVDALESKDEKVTQAKQFGSYALGLGIETMPELKKELEKLVDDNKKLINGEKLKTNYRKDILGDDPYVWDTGIYGNNEYSGPDPEKADAFHGTHVAGIIAAERDNGLGVNGVANNAEIMVLRVVSQADEYDKDVAKAIVYAVDNGAKIINGSFGKYHSTNPEWVWDALRYAAKNDVLFVNAAGNEGLDTDFTQVYPQDQVLAGEEVSDTFLTVGALNFQYGENLLANFSNYGKSTVDVFAPGVAIYSTAPNDKYRNAGGTSMAAPATAGVAAVIMSYFPKLSAAQVKQVIMDSGLSVDAVVKLGGNGENTKPFRETTKSGKMVNLYNALILASKL